MLSQPLFKANPDTWRLQAVFVLPALITVVPLSPGLGVDLRGRPGLGGGHGHGLVLSDGGSGEDEEGALAPAVDKSPCNTAGM